MKDPKERFTDRAADYARYRPPYSAAAYDAMLDGLDARAAADLGAGTGIASRSLAARGLAVYAVEPNAAMRAAGAGADGVEWRAGTGEETGLPDASVDLVLAAQAFHWFGAERAFAEMRRILRPGGRVALMWNLPDTDDPVAAAYDAMMLEVRDLRAVDRRLSLGAPLLSSPLFRDARRLAFRHTVPCDEAALVGRATSSSYFPKDGPVHDDLVARLQALHAGARGADGLAPFGYETLVWLATT